MEKSIFETIDLFKPGIIEASAGTGKTYTLTKLVIRIITSENIKKVYGNYASLSKVILVTFTEKAMQELKERLRQEIIDTLQNLKAKPSANQDLISHLKDSLYNFHQASIYTLHGFCNRIILENSIQMKSPPDPTIQSSKSILAEIIPTYFDRFGLEYTPYNNMPSKQQIQILADILSKYSVSKESILEPREINLDELELKLQRELQQVHKNLFTNASADVKAHPLITNLIALKQKKWQTLTGRQIREPLIDKLNVILSFTHKYFNNFSCDYIDEIKSVIENKKKTFEFLTNTDTNLLDLFYFKTQGITAKDILSKMSENTNMDFYSLMQKLEECFLNLHQGIVYLSNNKIIKKNIQFVESIHNEVSLHKKKNNIITYDDMIEMVKSVLIDKKNPIYQKTKQEYQFAIIDEFQDTNHSQWSIFKSLFLHNDKNKKHPTIWVCGDPKQSIYSFQGSNLEVYYKAKEDILKCGGNYYQLDTNYRSNPNMIAGYNHIFKHLFNTTNSKIKYQPVKAGLSTGKNENEKSIIFHETKENNKNISWHNTIVKTIAQILTEKKYLPNDICILAPKHNQIIDISKVLKEYNIPHFHYKKTGLYQSDECYHLILLLRNIKKTLSLSNFKLLLLSPFFNYSITSLKNIDITHPLIGDLQNLHLLFQQKKWNELLYNIRMLCQNYQGNNQKQHNLNDILLFLYEALIKKQLSFEETLTRLQRNYYSTNPSSDDDLFSIEPNTKNIQLMTYHAAKGLEFPVVFLTNINNKLKLPTKNQSIIYINSDASTSFWQTRPPKLNINLYWQQHYQESLRLYYVAMTRAKDALHLPYPTTSKKDTLTIEHKIKKAIDTKFGLFSVKKSDSLQQKPLPQKFNSSISHTTNDLTKLTAPVWNRLQKQISYSYLVHQKKDYFTIDERINKEEDPKIILDENVSTATDEIILNRGANIGSMLHDILENIPFKHFKQSKEAFLTNEFIKQKVQDSQDKYSTNEDDKSIKTILWNTFNTPISDPYSPKNSFHLRDITDYKPEIEFYFSFNKKGEVFTREKFPNYSLGYIDLFFKYQNRYYVLDWKSNDLDNYSNQTIWENMLKNHYDVQSLFYSSALHKWLENIIPNYNYDLHFGGIIYVYLRGMNQNITQGYNSYRPNKDEMANQIKQKLIPLLKNI